MQSRRSIRFLVNSILPVAVFLAGGVSAQQSRPSSEAAASGAKEVLTLADYPGWKRIQSASLSPDGRWMSYGYRPNAGDDTLFIRELDGATVHSVVRGTGPEFSADSRWATYTIMPPQADGRGGRGQGGRGQAPPGQRGAGAAVAAPSRTLQLLDLRAGAKTDVRDVESSAFSADARYLAVKRTRANREAAFEGSDVVLRNLADGTTQNIGNVLQYAFNESGTQLAYTVDAADHTGNGLYVLDLRAGIIRPLDVASAEYRQMSWSDDGTALAVLRGLKPEKKAHRQNVLVAFTGLNEEPMPVTFDPAKDATFPAAFVVSDLGTVRFTKDGSRVFFGIKPQEDEAPRSDEPQADMEVWHWKDADVQSIQKVRADQTRRFTYASVYNIGARKFIRLADDDMRTVTPTPDGRWGIGRLDAPYRYELNWGGARADYYRIDLNTGTRDMMVPALRRAMGTSPDGKWFLYMKDEKLQARNLVTGKTTDLSAAAGVSFVDADDDHDYEKPAYGLGGWSRDGRSVILDHAFDLWLVPLEGGRATNLTAGVGESEQIRFRVVNPSRGGRGGGRGGAFGGGAPADDPGIDLSKPVLLSAYGEWTKKSGYYDVKVGSTPRPIVFEDASIGSLTKADSADRVIFTKQTFTQFPDYWTASAKLTDARKVTDANPQITDFAWSPGRVLIDYTDSRANKLQATLTLPAGYQAGRRYPMLVYFYEKMSQNHHQFSMPVYDDRPHMSAYSSDGYLVLMPDIVYTIGKPGTSAMDDVGSAVKKVIELGYADPDHIALQGHSWGGYQSSFMVTQTDLFAAVVTGAPPTNLVSFYDELYKSSGTVQQGIMEIGQVRMGQGVTPWSAHELYESQSPIHNVEKISTPFMILQGTDDGAVDWHQGLEFYNAAKRHGKEVIFLSYNGEGHHLARKENQLDFQIRMKQFFDHYLKGTPMPGWMENGVPWVDRMKAGTNE